MINRILSASTLSSVLPWRWVVFFYAEVGLVYHGQFSRCDDPNLHGQPGILFFLFFAPWLGTQDRPEDTFLHPFAIGYSRAVKIWVLELHIKKQ